MAFFVESGPAGQRKRGELLRPDEALRKFDELSEAGETPAFLGKDGQAIDRYIVERTADDQKVMAGMGRNG